MFAKTVLGLRAAATVKICSRNVFTTKQNHFKVAVAGASGGIGQPLSLLLKQHKLITQISIYDIVHAPGVAADLSHICTPSIVTGYQKDAVKAALSNADIVVVPAGVPRKPGMTRDDLFSVNANTVKELTEVIAEVAPKALIAILTNPLNTVIPIAAEVMKKAGKYDKNKIFGVTTLDVVRAATFVSELLNQPKTLYNIPVIGGHSPDTLIPLFSQATPKVDIKDPDLSKIITRVQNAGTEVVKAKAGAGSATLSMAFAALKFTDGLLRGLNGEANVIECAYVPSEVVPDCSFLATPVQLGVNGIMQNMGLGQLSPLEDQLLKKAIPVLQKNIKKGVDFIAGGK